MEFALTAARLRIKRAATDDSCDRGLPRAGVFSFAVTRGRTQCTGFEGERTLLRIHVEEQDKFEGKPVYECIVELLRKRHMAGATAFRVVEGFGATGHMHHTGTWSITLDCPIIIECIDSDEKIQSVLPDLDKMIGGGIITLERVRVILYRKRLSDEDRDPRPSKEAGGQWSSEA